MALDFIYNGQGYGDVADRLLEANLDFGALRPFRDPATGRRFVSLQQPGGKAKNFLTNAPATLTKDQWLALDESIIRIAEPELRVWGDISALGLTYRVPNGMGTTVLQEQTMGDFGTATISMDGLKRSDRDRPEFDLRNFPLPIISGDIQFSARELAVARTSGAPLDTTSAERVTRRIAEQVESLTIGSALSYTYGGGTIYGLTNKPERVSKVLTLPTAAGWSPEQTVDEVLDMIASLQDLHFNGPYGVYFTPAWTRYLDGDYSSTYAGETLRTRLAKIEDIRFMRKINYGLTGYQIVVFQLTSDVIRAVTGMDLTTVQWDAMGGLAKNWKILCIMVPQLRTNANGTTGICHGVAA